MPREFAFKALFSDTLFDLRKTSQDEWYITQNDDDEDLSSNKWSSVGNPFMFHVCRISGSKQDNFLRTPFIPTFNVTYVYVSIEYVLNSCTDAKGDIARNNCAQSFHLHLKEVCLVTYQIILWYDCTELFSV